MLVFMIATDDGIPSNTPMINIHRPSSTAFPGLLDHLRGTKTPGIRHRYSWVFVLFDVHIVSWHHSSGWKVQVVACSVMFICMHVLFVFTFTPSVQSWHPVFWDAAKSDSALSCASHCHPNAFIDTVYSIPPIWKQRIWWRLKWGTSAVQQRTSWKIQQRSDTVG